MKKKLVALLFAGALAPWALAGCSTEAADQNRAAAKTPPKRLPSTWPH